MKKILSLILSVCMCISITACSNEKTKDIIETTNEPTTKSEYEKELESFKESVAEYVENENQRDKLKEMGCDIYQGYLYYRPLSKDDLLQKMMDQIAYKK